MFVLDMPVCVGVCIYAVARAAGLFHACPTHPEFSGGAVSGCFLHLIYHNHRTYIVVHNESHHHHISGPRLGNTQLAAH